MVNHMALWALGPSELQVGGKPVTFRTRKAFALFIYLYLEPGAHTRDHLMDLLWPGSLPAAGRASLRTALFHLHQALGPAARTLSSTRDSVELRPGAGAWSDVDEVTRVAREVRNGSAPAPESVRAAAQLWRGPLLTGFDLGSGPAWDEWLEARRWLLFDHLHTLLDLLTRDALGAGRLGEAQAFAERRVRLDPLSEDAYRALIEIQLAAGQPGAARATLERCQQVLDSELGVRPTSATLALVAAPTAAPPQPPPVASVPLRAGLGDLPLVGRERFWAWLTQAHARHRLTLLVGEPGIGKTRLMHQFALSRGPYGVVEGRPGDADVPYAAVARALRRLLRAHPELPLAPWQARELSRLLPELGHEPPPVTSEAGRLRLFEAVAELFWAGHADAELMLGEDLHYLDTASWEVLRFALNWLAEDNRKVFVMGAYRPGELAPEARRIVGLLVASGEADLLHLPPLELEAVRAFVRAARPQWPTPQALVARLHQFTGGNPLFLRETLAALPETLGDEEAVTLPLAPHVAQVILRRVAQLTKTAQDLLRLAALAGADFSGALALEVLSLDEWRYAEVLEELALAGLWQGERISHDLLAETLVNSLPAEVRSALHARLWAALERLGTSPALLVRHAAAAGRPQALVRSSLLAADAAYDLLERQEALSQYERVLAAWLQSGVGLDAAQVQRALDRYLELSRWQGAGARAEALRDQIVRATRQAFGAACAAVWGTEHG